MAVIPTQGIARIDLVSADPERLARFYVDAFGFEREPAAPRKGESHRVGLRLGAQNIALICPSRPGRPYPADMPGWSPAFQHFAIVVTSITEAMARLDKCSGWTPISRGGPQILPPNTGGVCAYKFRDPEGHPLEFLAFPRGAAPARWRDQFASGPCIGVDHSAISARDAAASGGFYRQFGFQQVGHSLNRGLEQERLDGIDAPVVDVFALAVENAAPPHLELLCYHCDFARAPAVLDLDDIAATRLVLAASDSAGPLRDPDGHWLTFEPAGA